MTQLRLCDRVPLENVRRTGDGYLVADCRVARTGIQLYKGSELGRPDLDVVRVYRPESSVFDAAAMASYAHRPMVNGHPGENVTAANWKDYATGMSGGDVVRDGQFVRVPLVMMDAAAIRDYESGERTQISMGYTAEVLFDAGTNPEGEPYDAYVQKMRMNHVSQEKYARGGDSLTFGDTSAVPGGTWGASLTEDKAMPDIQHKTVMVDGLSIQTTELGAQAIAKLQAQIGDAAGAAREAEKQHQTAMALKDGEIEKLKTELTATKAAVLSDAQIQERVASRATLIATAANFVDAATLTAKTDAEVRAAVVQAKFGDAAVTGKTDDYIQARFDMLVEDAGDNGHNDPVRGAFLDGRAPVQANTQDNGQDAYEKRISDAWKTAK